MDGLAESGILCAWGAVSFRFAEAMAANDARFARSRELKVRAAYASLGLALVAIVGCAAAILLSACGRDSNWASARQLDGFCLATNAQGRTLSARYPVESECWR